MITSYLLKRLLQTQYIKKDGKMNQLNKTEIELSENELKIIEGIKNYVNESIYNYAVMIDGEWGCGKTHFVKNHLIKELRENETNIVGNKERKIIYLSLFGVKTISDLSNQILMELILFNKHRFEKVARKGLNIITSIAPIAYGVLKNVTIAPDINEDNCESVFKSLFSIKNCILIFDDLERCECDLNEVLGLINSFVEHGGVKVIIVANQKEIGKNSSVKNKELKYLVALNPEIVTDTNESEEKINKAFLPDKKEEKALSLSVDQLNLRLNELFGEDTLYEMTKEKLIGQVYYYQPDLIMILNSLITENIHNKDLKKYLLDNIESFAEYMLQEDHVNLRTFQFYLSKIVYLYNEIIISDNEYKTEFARHVIQYCFKACIAYKTNTLENKWQYNEYDYVPMGNMLTNSSIFGFKFVDDYIINNTLNNVVISKMIDVFVKEYFLSSSPEIKLLNDLGSNCYEYEDSEVEDKMKKILLSLKENKFGFNVYPRIVKIFVHLISIGFDEKYIIEMKRLMLENIKNTSEYFDFNDVDFWLGVNIENRHAVNEILDLLINQMNIKSKLRNLSKINGFLMLEKDWAQQLYDYTKKVRQEIVNGDGYLSRFDIEKLIDKIEKSSPKDIQSFRKCILLIYRETYSKSLKQDIKQMQEIIKRLEKIKDHEIGNINKVQIGFLIENLKDAEKHFSVL